MLIVMKADATDSQVEAVLRVIEELGYKGHPMPGVTRTAIGITGNQTAVDPSNFENLAGVAEAIRVSKPYKLITLDLRPEKTVVRLGDATIGGDELAIIYWQPVSPTWGGPQRSRARVKKPAPYSRKR